MESLTVTAYRLWNALNFPLKIHGEPGTVCVVTEIVLLGAYVQGGCDLGS